MIRYAKNTSGKLGVVPENYVQALADPPEPNEPPPPVSYPSLNRSYPSYDSNSSSNNNSRASYQSNSDPHHYMNPEAMTNWSAPELPSWTPVERSVRKVQRCKFLINRTRSVRFFFLNVVDSNREGKGVNRCMRKYLLRDCRDY